MDISKRRIDAKKSVDGVWFDLDTETRLLIGRVASPAYKRLLREKMLPFVDDIRNNSFSQDEQDRITAEVFSELVLLKWEGLKENGVDIPYSKERALELLSDPALEWFREQVEDFGTRMDNFYEEAEDNLKKS